MLKLKQKQKKIIESIDKKLMKVIEFPGAILTYKIVSLFRYTEVPC